MAEHNTETVRDCLGEEAETRIQQKVSWNLFGWRKMKKYFVVFNSNRDFISGGFDRDQRKSSSSEGRTNNNKQHIEETFEAGFWNGKKYWSGNYFRFSLQPNIKKCGEKSAKPGKKTKILGFSMPIIIFCSILQALDATKKIEETVQVQQQVFQRFFLW